MAAFALIWWLTESTGSATLLALLSFAIFLPQVVLGPFVGALVDRWDRRKIMIIADGLVATATGCLAILFLADAVQVWHIVVANFVNSIGGSFQGTAMATATSLMVPKQHLSRVQGANQALNGTLNIVAPPLGAVLVALLPMQNIMALDVATAAFAIMPLFFVVIPQHIQTTSSEISFRSVARDVAIGLRYIRNHSGILTVMLIGASSNFFLNADSAVIPILVTEHFDGDALQLGWFGTAFGIGTLLGGIVLSVWGGFRRRILT